MVALSVHGFFQARGIEPKRRGRVFPMEFSAAWIRFQFAMKKLTHRMVGQLLTDSPTWAAVRWQICLGRQTLFELGLGVEQRLREVVRQLLEVGRVQLELFGPGGLVDAGHRGELLGAGSPDPSS